MLLLIAVFIALVVATINGVRTRDRRVYSAWAAIQRPTPIKGVLIVLLIVIAVFMR